MPDYGRLTQDRLPHALPLASPLYPPPPWPLPAARILKLTFEVDKDVALNWLPPGLSRSSPAYAIVTVAHYPQSPVGPFSLAAQYIGCRARIFIRAFTLQAITDSEAALAALREVWGFPAKLGRVRLTAGASGASARVSRGGLALAALRLRGLQPIDPASVRFDPMLNVRIQPAIEEGKRHSALEMVQVDPSYVLKEAFRGRGELRYPSASEGDLWQLLAPLNMISATYTVADTELPFARFVMSY